MTSGDLTSPQLRALLDILVHYETYAEVQSFRNPGAIENYGWPFIDRDKNGRPTGPHSLSSSPLLQLLLTRLVLPAPAVRDLSTEFWTVKFKGIMKQFGDANLSDSYEKGTLGTRKRLASAASVVHEAVTRGLLSGVSCDSLPDLHSSYNRDKAEDLMQAWRDCICHLVYGNLIDEIFEQFTQTTNLEAHSPAIERAIEYAEIHIATFLHQVFVLSVEGPYLLKLIENLHKLVPYTVVGQTLRLGNAASMINAMSRLFLSKVSMGAISNWIGLTSNASDGMNLMQRIFSLVLDWDASDFRKAAEKIKLNQDGMSQEHLMAIEGHLAADRSQRDLAHEKSIQEQKSIIVVIFEAQNQQLAESLTDGQHTSCLEYYAAKIAIRDREKISDVLCSSSPDVTTAVVLEGIAALDPMIRVVHQSVDLRKHLGAVENFLTDFIKTVKPKAQDGSLKSNPLTVGDFVKLLRRNRHLLWAYLHDFCSGCPDLRDTWRDWMNDAIKAFQRKSTGDQHESNDLQTPGAGDMGPSLQDAVNKLSDSQKKSVYESIEAHSKYVYTLREQSRAKLQKVLEELHERRQPDAKDMMGPGIYASRWQALLDETMITPSTPNGPLRSGKDVKGLRAMRKPDDQANTDTSEAIATTLQQGGTGPEPPDVSAVVAALGEEFKNMVANISRDGLPKR
ncbi:hypothetical protein F4802DRAFT_342457 [Xylaria palmicola]|nr:hypothetical protein F4802DRAFT_342457 [Xylaria palmicola]